MVGHHLPGIGIMLQQSESLAPHHLKMHIGFKDHAHQGRMWQDLHHPLFNPVISAPLQHFRPESRAVHTVDPQYPLLYRLLAVHGAVYRQIPALGMASHIEIPAKPGCHCIQICNTVRLPRHRRQEGHIEILLPAYDGLVRSPEGNIGTAVIQETGQRGKLCLPSLFDNICKIIQLHIPESPALNHPRKQRPVLFLIAHVRKQFFKIRMFRHTFQCHPRAALLHIRHHSIELQIRKLTQHKRVYLCHRHLLKGIFSEFFQILNHCSHSASSFLPSGFPFSYSMIRLIDACVFRPYPCFLSYQKVHFFSLKLI